MIGELATAIANGLTSSQLMHAMRAHPIVSTRPFPAQKLGAAGEQAPPDGSGCKTDPISR
ncbi:MAG: hypothetical protein ACLTT1_08375 [[Clostridium] scindens]